MGEGTMLRTMFEMQLHEDPSPNSAFGNTTAPSCKNGRN
jgi:hypothetical protein